LDEDVHLLDVFLVDELQGIEPLDLAGQARGELRRIEARDRTDPASPAAERVPVRLVADAHRRHQADARHDHPPAQRPSWGSMDASPDRTPGGDPATPAGLLPYPRRGLLLLAVRLDVLDGFLHARDLLRVVVGDLDPELLLERHDE